MASSDRDALDLDLPGRVRKAADGIRTSQSQTFVMVATFSNLIASWRRPDSALPTQQTFVS
jgi:hypothetical protein